MNAWSSPAPSSPGERFGNRLGRTFVTRCGRLGRCCLLGLALAGFLPTAWGASGGPALAHLPPRPSETPDVVILGIAGFFTGLGPIGTSGLYFTTGTQLLVDTFRDLGQSVQWRDYAPSMGRQHISIFYLTLEQGLEQAVRDIEWIKAHWQDGVSNPTRLVLISASGGGGSMHLLPFMFPDVQFDYMIDTDTGCGGLTLEYISWWLTTPPWKKTYMRQHLHEVPRRLMPWIFGVPAPCSVGPRHRQTINNLVPDNVVYNLDVRTALLSSPRMITPIPFVGPALDNILGFELPFPVIFSPPVGISFNSRPGFPDGRPHRGEQAGIYRYVDTTSIHPGFDMTSDGGRWVTGKILELGLPPWQPPPAKDQHPPAGVPPQILKTMVWDSLQETIDQEHQP